MHVVAVTNWREGVGIWWEGGMWHAACGMSCCPGDKRCQPRGRGPTWFLYRQVERCFSHRKKYHFE